MSYYENQWSGASTSTPSQPQWEHASSTGTSTPVRAGASAPQSQDDYAFFYQFDEVDRAYENLSKSGKGYGMGGRGGRMSHGSSRHFDENRSSSQGPNLHNFYASQRHQPSRGSNEAEQVMQAKRRMAAQRERELRNLHTEQQYQRTVLSEVPHPNSKHMSEEERHDLIARQRSALYGEGAFSEKTSYVDENGNVRTGAPGPSSASSLRGHSPLTYDAIGRAPPTGETGTPAQINDPNVAPTDPSPRPQSTASPQTAGPTNKVFDNAVGAQSRTSTSSPTGGSPPRDLSLGARPGQSGGSVAPIGTRPSGTPTTSGPSKRSTPPVGTSGAWGHGNGVWGQTSGLGAQASVWG